MAVSYAEFTVSGAHRDILSLANTYQIVPDDYGSLTRSPKLLCHYFIDDRNLRPDDWKDTLAQVASASADLDNHDTKAENDKETRRARQPVAPAAGYDALRKLGEQALPELEHLLDTLNFPVVHLEDTTPNELDARLHQDGPLVIIAPLKAEARATEKVESDYRGDWSRLFDILRAAVAVDSMQEVQEAAQALEDAGAVLARPPKDRFTKPLGNGYRDFLLNVRLPSGVICEIQLHLKPILAAREKEKLAYDIVRAIRAALKEEGRDSMTSGEVAAVQRARDASKQLFEQAWLEIVQREKGEKFLGNYLMKAGYTGTFVDRLGRQTCYAGGKKIACIKPGAQEHQEGPSEQRFIFDDTAATQEPQERDRKQELGGVSPHQVYYALVFDQQGRILVRPSDTQLGGFIWMAPKPGQETQPPGATVQEEPSETVSNHLSRAAGVQARKFAAIDDAEDGDGYFLMEGRGGTGGDAQWLSPAEVKKRLQQAAPEWQKRGRQILAVAVHKWQNSGKTGEEESKDLLPDGRRAPKQLQMPKLLTSPFSQVTPRRLAASGAMDQSQSRTAGPEPGHSTGVEGLPQTKTTSAPKLTGPIQDSMGRRQCFRDGKPSPCAQFGGKGEGWGAQRSGEDLWDAARRLADMIKRGDAEGGDELVGMLTSAPPEDLAKLKRDHGLLAGQARAEIAQKLQEKLQSLGYAVEGQEQQKSLHRARAKAGPQSVPQPAPTEPSPAETEAAPSAQLDPPLAQALSPKQETEQAAPAASAQQPLAQYGATGSRILPYTGEGKPWKQPPSALGTHYEEPYRPQIEKTREYYHNRPDSPGDPLDTYGTMDRNSGKYNISTNPVNFRQLIEDNGVDALDNVQSLRLTGKGDDVATLFDNPAWLDHITTLTLEGSYGAPRSQRDVLPLDKILAAPGLENLRKLDISSYLLGRDGVEEIANTPSLRNLETLTLQGVDIRGSARALIQSPYLQNLQVLDLFHTRLTSREKQALRDHFGDRVIF